MNSNRTKQVPNKRRLRVMTGEKVQEPGIFGRYFQPHTDEFYLLFRIVFAVLVGLHGAQKAFLLWDFPAGANPNGLGTLVDIAGWVELAAALLIGLGMLHPIGGRSAGCNDDRRILWSSRCAQHGVALAAPVSQPARRRQRLRTARRRGHHPLVHNARASSESSAAAEWGT